MELPVVFNNRYQLVKKIGEGGLAEVYQAQDMALGRMVAVKALRSQYTRDPNFLVNFHREAQSVAKLSDTYIVAVYDFGQDKSRPYIVFEWIPGSDLRKVIDEHNVISVRQTVEYGIQICSAVGAAHRAGLVHGDLKPGNILVTPGNQAKVTDFGLARALGASAMDDGEVVWGTPAYFAPEQAAGDRVLPATDVYAMGIILYEMLTGQVPFRGKDDQEVARKQLYEAHVPVDKINPSIPEPLARIVDAAMAKNVNERFLTADHLREALISYKQGGLRHQAPIASVVGSPVQQPPLPRPSQTPHQTHQGQFVSASQSANQRPKSEGRAFDYILLVLGLVAIVAVLGLVILFSAIYAAYVQGAIPPLDPALPISNTAAALIPDIVGLDETNAQLQLADLGLTMVIDGEEHHPTWPVGAVIRQSFDVGSQVEPGTTVGVTLSRGPKIIELPNIIGMNADEAETLLTSLDLVPQKYEEWSVESPGLVIRQDPDAGVELEDRTLVTLFVSSGSRVPINANFGQEILLSAYEIPRTQYRIGESISLTFFWNLLTSLNNDYTLYIYLTTPQGGIVSEASSSTSGWPIGEIKVDPQQLPIPTTTAPGDYQIQITFYNTNADRLTISDVGRGSMDNVGALILHTVQVVQ